MNQVSIYLAGGLFNAAERAHNSRLEKGLIETARSRGINLKTTLPQRTALRRYIPEEKRFDVAGIVADCEIDAASHDYILCNLDGADADSGTAVELGIARGQRIAYWRFKNTPDQMPLMPEMITYRTDFRTALDRELGVNAMLQPAGSTLIYHPCFAVNLGEFDKFYEELSSKIVEVIAKGKS